MYVCSCRGIKDSTINAAIADGARTIAEIAERCSAGACCQGCWPELERLLAAAQRRDGRGGGHVAA